jgi:hypothetical protein
MRSELDWGWVIGLLEGEGCFTIRSVGKYRYPRIIVASTDFDVLHRLQSLVPGNLTGPYDPKANGSLGSKPQMRWTSTKKGDTIDLMKQLLPHMSERRKARIEEVLAATS